MAIIRLENSDCFAIIDNEDMDKCYHYKWYINKQTGYVYGYFGKNKKVLLHRYIMNISNPKIQIDHIDNNRLDCRKTQLRICTNQQNTCNQRKRKIKTTSIYKGVSWEPRVKKWRTTIFQNYKQIHVGTFNSEKEAALAYNRKALEVHGEFALLNKVT